MFKKFPLDEKSVTKHALFFFFRKLQIIEVLLLIRNCYTRWSTWLISLNCMCNFPFSISSRFYETLYFCSMKYMDSLTLKRHNSLQKIKIIEKWHTVLFPGLWFLSCNKKFENWPGDEIFVLLISKFWVFYFFWVATFK